VTRGERRPAAPLLLTKPLPPTGHAPTGHERAGHERAGHEPAQHGRAPSAPPAAPAPALAAAEAARARAARAVGSTAAASAAGGHLTGIASAPPPGARPPATPGAEASRLWLTSPLDPPPPHRSWWRRGRAPRRFAILGAGFRLAVRRVLLLILLASLALSGQSLATIARSPGIAPFVDRGVDGIDAAMERALAQEATPQRIETLLRERLAEEDRNWLAIRALEGVAAERAIPLAPDLTTALAEAWEQDSGFWASAGGCLACAYDPAECTLSAELLCQAPMVLTPFGDIAGVAKEGLAYTTGAEVDEINLALSLVGLGATALVVASGGSSVTVKIGASVAKLARRMGLVSPRLGALASDALRSGVDWARVPAVRGSDDLAAVLRPDRFAPLVAIAGDLGRTSRTLGTPSALHLLRYVDDAPDARRIANAAEALGPKTVGRMEVLGKSRFLRATVRLSNLALELFAGLIGLLLSAASLLGSSLSSLAMRGLRRAARG